MNLKEKYLEIIANTPNCKVRESQLAMAQYIEECFLNAPDRSDEDEMEGAPFKAGNGIADDELTGKNICLIEAPTGTGKSFAYLLAGVIAAQKLGKKLVISTATKTLQSQLVEKDIPNLIKYSGINFNYTLAKGRGNYLCPYQLELNAGGMTGDMFAGNEAPQEKMRALYQLHSNKSWDGDLDNAPIAIEPQLKAVITTDKERCLAYSCSYNQKGDCNCPYYNARDTLKSSSVIIVNHSLLLADLVTGGSVLPIRPKDYLLCIDEGHNFADVAINSFSRQFELKHTIGSCQNLVSLIYNPQTQYFYTNTTLCDSVTNKVHDLIAALDELLFLFSQNQQLFSEDERLILNDYLNPEVNTSFRDLFVKLAYLAAEVAMHLLTIQEELREILKSGQNSLIETNLNKLGYYITLIDTVLMTSQYIINTDDSRYNAHAKWIELNIRDNVEEFTICAIKTHIGNLLWQKLWSQVHAAVLTSATLAIGRDFGYYLHKLGLPHTVKGYKLPSSFNYMSNSQIAVPRFRYAPEHSARQEFTQELISYLTKSLDYEENYGTLVLFFNRSLIKEVHSGLPMHLQQRALLQTNFTSNQRLIDEHKKRIDSGKTSIIFGLNSFAEGVDLPSRYCMHVIISKLPFDTHKDPQSMVEEYWVRFEKNNYFTEVALPEACIRLIQATGRLIRSEVDYGQVSICDSRIVTKGYGATLLNALPAFNRKYRADFLTWALEQMDRAD